MQSDTISIEIIDVEQTQAFTKTQKPYVKLNIVHKNLNFGKVDQRVITPFFDSEPVHKILKNAVKGEQYVITRQKPGDFWNWVEAVKAEGGPTGTKTSGETMAATRPAGANKPQYETAEDRAFKQVMIVRQSCLGYAISTMTPGAKAALDPEAVVALASHYADWVTSKDTELPVSEIETEEVPE